MTSRDRDKRIAELKSLILPYQKELNVLLNEADDDKPNKLFTCGHCKKKSKIKDYIEYMSYSIDYDGDWHPFNETNIICPKCNWKNRLLSKKSIEKWKDLSKNGRLVLCEKRIKDIIGRDIVQNDVHFNSKTEKYYYEGKVVYDNFVNI